ncbi:putative lipase [Mycolicibacterium arabiense]|uniref:Putative lipase n=1 Tax=Mycolicibacterium arabiense TaxID=1286181 RepID=A0A7I7S4U6_9MYCO|nr:lipase family protein [Mycolicibacterium arabiense]BBY51025.1 putative lipase [Mycolicibacterium arabiense]
MTGHAGRRHGRSMTALLLALALALSGCASEPSPETAPSAAPIGARGTLLGEPSPLPVFPALDRLSQRAIKVRYQSTSGIDGSAATVSGVVFVPNGDPPEGGWPVASIGHPTAGLGSSCAPSSYPGLMGNAGTVAAFLTFGFLVTMSDYEGLGTPGPHPYLEPKSAAYNVIDAVRAAREVVPEASTSWVGYGVSQGGQAVWAANELATEYGSGLNLVGSISVAAPTDLRPLVDAMVDGTLTVEQRVLMPSILRGLRAAHPELRIEDYLHGTMLERMNAFAGCENENSEVKGLIAQAAPASDFTPSSPEAAEVLRRILGGDALPQRRASAPMLVAYGDEDRVVLPAWTAAAVARACGMGDVVDTVVAPGQGHGQLDLGAVPAEWTKARFAGLPPTSTCPPP